MPGIDRGKLSVTGSRVPIITIRIDDTRCFRINHGYPNGVILIPNSVRGSGLLYIGGNTRSNFAVVRSRMYFIIRTTDSR